MFCKGIQRLTGQLSRPSLLSWELLGSPAGLLCILICQCCVSCLCPFFCKSLSCPRRCHRVLYQQLWTATLALHSWLTVQSLDTQMPSAAWPGSETFWKAKPSCEKPRCPRGPRHCATAAVSSCEKLGASSSQARPVTCFKDPAPLRTPSGGAPLPVQF